MTILNEKQLSYLKSLDTNEKRKDFVLECIVENAIGESEKLKQPIYVNIYSQDLEKKLYDFHLQIR